MNDFSIPDALWKQKFNQVMSYARLGNLFVWSSNPNQKKFFKIQSICSKISLKWQPLSIFSMIDVEAS